MATSPSVNSDSGASSRASSGASISGRPSAASGGGGVSRSSDMALPASLVDHWDDNSALSLVDHSALKIATYTQPEHGEQLRHPAADVSFSSAAAPLSGTNRSRSSSVDREHADAGTDSETHESSSIGSSVFVLSATTLGAGILALPYAMAQLGWLFGSLLLICIGLASSYAILLLLRSADVCGATTYEELGHALFPRFGRKLVVTCTLVLIFGSLTAFFVIIADTVTPAVQDIAGSSDNFFVHKAVLLVGVAVCIVYPLCLLRSVHALERWSFLAVGIILVFSVVMVVESIRALHAGTAGPDSKGNNPDLGANVKLITLSVDTFEAVPIICLAFTCQTMVFPIWNSLRGGTGLAPSLRSTGLAPVSSMWTVANRALSLCGLAYLIVGCFGYVLWGRSTASDVLNNFPDRGRIFWDVVRVGFVLAICIHYPVVHFGFRGAILHTWFGDKTDAENRVRFHLLTVSTVAASLLLALALPDLNTVFGLTGALCAFPYCFMFPTLFYLRLHQPESQPFIVFLRGPRALARESQEAYAAEAGTAGAAAAASTVGAGAGAGERKASAGDYQPLYSSDVEGEEERVTAYVGTGVRKVSAGAVEPVLDPMPRHCGCLAASTLPLSHQLPAYGLLVLASILWIVCIVVNFRDVINQFT